MRLKYEPVIDFDQRAFMQAPGEPGEAMRSELQQIVDLCADTFRFDFAVISLIEEDRIAFRLVSQRFDEQYCDKVTLFCLHAARVAQILIKQSRSKSESSVEEFEKSCKTILFSVGVPLKTPTGKVIGSLCAFSSEPATFLDSERDAIMKMKTYATSILSSLENRKPGTGREYMPRSAWKENREIELLKEQNATLLRELQHRSKHNLQFFSSMLFLKAQMSGTGKFSDFLNGVRNKMRVVSIAHDLQLENEMPDQVHAGDYITKVISDFRRSHYSGREISYSVDVVNPVMPMERAVVLAMVLLELLTNSYEHAFDGIEFPAVRICLFKDGEEWNFIYSDNGAGLPISFEPGCKHSFGMQMLGILLGHLKAQYVVNRSNGTEYLVRWF